MTDQVYRLFSWMVIRVAGVPVETMERTATPLSAASARDAVALKARLEELGRALLALPEIKLVKKLTRAIARSRPLPPDVPCDVELAASYTTCHDDYLRAIAATGSQLEGELQQAREALAELRPLLQRYLLFGSELVQASFGDLEQDAVTNVRNRDAKHRDGKQILYLERMCAKNDTFSEFGPLSWVNNPGGPEFVLSPEPGIKARDTYLEVWAVRGLTEVIGADPEARPQLLPRREPTIRFEADRAVRVETGEEIELGHEELAVLSRCDGKTPAHVIGSLDRLAELATRGLVIWTAEAPALDRRRMEFFASEVAAWQDGPAKERWLPVVQSLVELVRRFGATDDYGERRTIMQRVYAELAALEIKSKTGTRELYVASNAIGESCSRACTIVIPDAMVNQLTHDAAPWFDLWRDTYAFTASRVATRLRELHASAPRRNGRTEWLRFVRHAGDHGLDLLADAIPRLAHDAFEEVEQVFTNSLGARADAAELELTREDCACVRRAFSFPKFDALTWPSADLQIAAKSVDSVRRGDYRWVIGELHASDTVLSFVPSLADRAPLRAELQAASGGVPIGDWGRLRYDRTNHTTFHWFEIFRDQWTFVSPHRGRPEWPTVSPADLEVHVDEDTGDVRLRVIDTGRVVCSLARGDGIPWGVHPFFFSRAPGLPRLQLGKVVVQRRLWFIDASELTGGPFTGTSPALMIAVAQLRASKGLPRCVFIRPSQHALRRGTLKRDKNIKPIFVDFDSYLSVEQFNRWLIKHGELEMTEMMPGLDEQVWMDTDGRHTFELRTLILPA